MCFLIGHNTGQIFVYTIIINNYYSNPYSNSETFGIEHFEVGRACSVVLVIYPLQHHLG